MKSTKQKNPLFLLLIAGALFAAADHSDDLEIDSQIRQWLSDAAQAPDQQLTQDNINKARAYLRQNRNQIDSFYYAILDNQIDQTIGRLAVARWKNDTQREDIRIAAQKLLDQTFKNAQSLRFQIEQEINDLEGRLGPDAQNSPKWKNLSALSTRMEFDSAWTLYNLARVQTDPAQRDRQLQTAQKNFAAFTRNGYRDHPVISQCYLGQALCLFEQKKYDQVVQILDRDLITPENSTNHLFKRISYIRIQSWRKLFSDAHVIWAAQDYFYNLPEQQTLDTMELEMLLEYAKSIASLLARDMNLDPSPLLEQLESTAQRLYPYGSPWCDQFADKNRDIHLEWGHTLALTTRKLFRDGRYKDILQKLTQSPAPQPHQKVPDPIRSEIQFFAAAAAWNTQDFQNAWHWSKQFLLSRNPDTSDTDRINSIVQIAIRSGMRVIDQISKDDDRRKTQAAQYLQLLDVIEKIQPTCPEMKRLPWFRGWAFMQAGDLEQTQTNLNQITPDSPDYIAALYYRSLAKWQRNDFSNAADILTECAAQLKNSPTPAQQYTQPAYELGFRIAQKLIQQNLPAEAIQLVDTLQRLTYDSAQWSLRQKLLLLQNDLLTGNSSDLQAAYEKTIQQAALNLQDPFVLESLVHLTKILEQKTPSDQTRRSILLEIYSRLLQNPTLKLDPAAIHDRMAQLYYDSGQYPQAREQFQWLLDQTPLNQQAHILRGLAISLENMGQYDLAWQHWNTLSIALPQATDPWLEANVHRIQCLINQGHADQAADHLRLFLLQYGSLLNETSREKFQTLIPESPGGDT